MLETISSDLKTPSTDIRVSLDPEDDLCPADCSLQCTRFWWGFWCFSSFECLAASLDSLQTGRIGARMRMSEEVEGGEGKVNRLLAEAVKVNFSFPSSSPSQFFFLPPTGLVNLLPRPNSPMFSSFKMAAWTSDGNNPLAPAKSRLHCRLSRLSKRQTPKQHLFSGPVRTVLDLPQVDLMNFKVEFVFRVEFVRPRSDEAARDVDLSQVTFGSPLMEWRKLSVPLWPENNRTCVRF